MLAYSSRAFRALVFLFRPYNDIDVYIEDTLCRNLYEIIINRILSGRAKVTRIFQLGGREAVVDECRRHQGASSRRSLYIIDADYDLLLDIPPPPLDRLYRLNVYCAENLLVCGTAVEEIAFESMSNSRREDVSAHLKYAKWLAELEHLLVNLFVVYAAAHRLSPAIQTSGYHVYQLCVQIDGQPNLDGNKVRSRRRDVIHQLEVSHSRQEIQREINAVRTSLRKRLLSCRHIVSGKTYLLPLLNAHLRRKARYRSDHDTLKVQLSRHCSLDIDPGFRKALEDASLN